MNVISIYNNYLTKIKIFIKKCIYKRINKNKKYLFLKMLLYFHKNLSVQKNNIVLNVEPVED